MGDPISNVAAGLLTSTEYQGAGLSDADFVSQMYTGALGRSADTSGANYWTGLLAQGFTRATVMLDITSTTEAVQHSASVIGSGLFLPKAVIS